MKNSGFTLVELLVVLGICTLLAVFGGEAMANYSKQTMFTRVISARNDLLHQITAYAGSQYAITNSAKMPGNSYLAACLGQSSSVTCTSDTPYPMTLYPPGNSASMTAESAISGPDNSVLTPPGIVQPRYFSALGSPCPTSVTAATANCPIGVTTFFMAQCPPNFASGLDPATTCSGQMAEVIKVFYSIQPAPGVALGGAGIAQIQGYNGVLTLDPSL
jgi:prepilin-type N-terminal cleavage/methylation domain-containing protein